jgi:hypothetical protein
MFNFVRHSTVVLAAAGLAVATSGGGCGVDSNAPAPPPETTPSTLQQPDRGADDPANACIAGCLAHWRACVRPPRLLDSRDGGQPRADDECAAAWSRCVSACFSAGAPGLEP